MKEALFTTDLFSWGWDHMSIQLICLIVVAAVALNRVLELIRKKKVSDKVVVTEQADELVVMDEGKLVPEQVRKALEKAKKAAEQEDVASEEVNDKAIADYTEAICLDPACAKAYRNRTNAYVHRKDYDRAIADFTEALRLDAADNQDAGGDSRP